MSYKVEELLALRDSVSESAVSLDKFADEEVIKEHVLRPSASATLASAASEKDLRASLTPALTPAAPDKKPSPSPSIKRGKAERLLKEHGSPPGMRVTAGGRIVPSDLPPLNNVRYVNNTYKAPTLQAPGLGDTMSTQRRADTTAVTRLELVGNQPVLYVGDRAYALPALEAASSTAPSAGTVNLETTTKTTQQVPVLTAQPSYNSLSVAPPRTSSQTPFAGLDLSALRTQQNLKKQELRTIEQTEVLQANHQPDSWRQGIIEKKRNLIIELDGLRKQITALETAENNASSTPLNGFAGSVTSTSTAAPSSFAPQYQQPLPSPMFGYPVAAPFAPMMMYPPSFGAYPNTQPTEPASFVPTSVPKPLSPGPNGRRSHAVAIKQPRVENKKQGTSALDPKSPTYEPAVKSSSTNTNVHSTPSPTKKSPWGTHGVSQSDKYEDQALSQKPSLSSIDTTDFFPTNTHEHSSTRVAPKAAEPSTEPSALPLTPEKSWPASPWNEGKSSRPKKVITKLNSWPDSLGKPPSAASLKQGAMVQPPTVSQERGLLASSNTLKSTISSSKAPRKGSGQHFGSTNETCTLDNPKPVNRVPATYQEGYQAGYDHSGMPDNVEVLKGYVQGLFQFLSDEQKGRNNSLRDLVISSTPRDSITTMPFGYPDAAVGSQENTRSGKSNYGMDVRKDSAYDSQEVPGPYAVLENVAEHYVHTPPISMHMNAADGPDMAPTHRRVSLAAPEKGIDTKEYDKGAVSRTDRKVTGAAFPRQFSGNQLGARNYGKVSMQHHASAKEHASNALHANTGVLIRTFGDQRMSGLDGTMDDLIDLEPEKTARNQSTEDGLSAKANEEEASCFRATSVKTKQKSTSSPSKQGTSTERRESSPAKTPGSPKKSGEHSPAKAKLEHVTNRFRRSKKDDVRNLSPNHKRQRAQKWHRRFQQLKDGEAKEIEERFRRSAGEQGQGRDQQ
ncbi:hypothetical protein DM02DRAFT_665765 [Periconia macrospinosa]|uniref:Uncharacterized protein n=1 Tax=Periconia macrospinosa TaxID=97972 RepID=A0A2V1ECY4_9PLEO|nr:hypothetical protein DM02DRAFT_665765 [Periconia macrospinosa]